MGKWLKVVWEEVKKVVSGELKTKSYIHENWISLSPIVANTGTNVYFQNLSKSIISLSYPVTGIGLG